MSGRSASSSRHGAQWPACPTGTPEYIPPRRIGVLLVNLGTPEATDYWSMRRYLKEFLSDRRVIEENRVWWLVLNLDHPTVRPGRKGRDYDKIWNTRAQRGPAEDHHPVANREARRALRRRSKARRGRLGDALRQAVDRVAARGAAAGAATAFSSCRSIRNMPRPRRRPSATRRSMRSPTMRWQPALRVAAPYYDDPVYIDALAASLQASLGKLDVRARGDPRLLPRHAGGLLRQGRSLSLPLRQDGAAVAREARACDDKLHADLPVALRAGRMAEALHRQTVEGAGRRGVKHLAVITPGFAADCLETLEEIAIENAGYFRAAAASISPRSLASTTARQGMKVIRAVVRARVGICKGWDFNSRSSARGWSGIKARPRRRAADRANARCRPACGLRPRTAR